MSTERILELHIELGRCRMSISEFRTLSVGTTLELNTPTRQPLAIYANDVLVAYGKIVAVDNEHALQLTELTLPPDMRDLI